MVFSSTAARVRRTHGLGFTLIEILVSVLLIALFFLSYLEWTTARAIRARQLAALEQMEQVRRAALAFAADTQHNAFLAVKSAVGAGALARQKAIWPHDNVSDVRIYNRGMAQLLRGGYLAPAFSTVYPGTRWVLDAIPGPIPAGPTSGDRPIWLKVRYEAPETYGYGRDFQVLAGAFSQWSRYQGSGPCRSDLAELGSEEAVATTCTAVEFYLVRSDVSGLTVASAFWPWLRGEMETASSRALCIDRNFLDNNTFSKSDCEDGGEDGSKFDKFNLKFINFEGGSLKRIRRLIVGGRPGQNYRYENGQPLAYEEHAENSGLQNNLDLLDGPADGNFANALAKWNEKIGNDRDFNNHIVLNNATNNFKYAGTPLNVNNGQQKKYARYLTHVSGLYAHNLHLGHSWSEPVRAPEGYSIKEMPIGTGLTRHYWTASDIPKLPGWWPHPAGSHQKFYFLNHSPAPYENQPYYNAKANSNNGAFQASFNAGGTAKEKAFPAYNYIATPGSSPTGKANRQIARDFTAINIGYAGFNKAILGAYGLYTSNLVLGDRNSARNTRYIKHGCKYRDAGAFDEVYDCSTWPTHAEGLISYFTEFRFRNVQIEVGTRGLQPDSDTTWTCARRTGLIQVQTANDQVQQALNNAIAEDERLFRIKNAVKMLFALKGMNANSQEPARRYSRGLRGAHFLASQTSSIPNRNWHSLNSATSSFNTDANEVFNIINTAGDSEGYLNDTTTNTATTNTATTNTATTNTATTVTEVDTLIGNLNTLVVNISRTNSNYLTHLSTLLVTNKTAQGMLNWMSHDCNQDHQLGKINPGPAVPRPSSSLGPAPQTAWQNFSDVGFMNGLLRRSDARLKKNIRPLQVRAGALEQIRLWSFSHKADPSERKQLGFVAQEVNAHYPELVRTDEDGYLSMSYDGMVPILWGHLSDWKRTHNARVQNMKARAQDLRAQAQNMKASAQDIDARLKLLEQQAAFDEP